MTGEPFLLYAGVVFLLIALVGGGFSVKEVKLPPVAGWARLLAGLLGAAFVLLYFLPLDDDPDGDQAGGPYTLHRQEVGALGVDGLQVLDFVVTSPRREPRVGDTLTLTFTLRAVETPAAPTRLVGTYVSTEAPSGENLDFGWSRTDLELVEGASLTGMHQATLPQAGTWTLWPCYALDLPGGEGEDVWCRRWNAIDLVVR
jgi:hypothetical protein